MKILYYDCFAGISGDMNLGALVDIGVDEKYLIKELKKLNIKEFDVQFEKKIKNGISGTKAQVVVKDAHQHDHNHRTFKEIKKIISESELNDAVKEMSIKIFTIIGETEAKIHQVPIENIHFHEVGAVDSIVDIVGAAICLDFIKPDKIISSSVELGGGFVTCAHGIFPVPAPATADILKGIPVKTGAVQNETTTPTGAAILAASVNEFSDKIEFNIKKIGYGLGTRDLDIPNVLRIYLAETESGKEEVTSESTLIECNIDDMNPEFYEYIFEMLFKAGASDVYITPIIMKKSRPAVKLSVLCEFRIIQVVEKILFEETSTLGLRKYKVNKEMLNRQIDILITPYGDVKIKTAFFKGKFLRSKPEYEDCLKIAREKQIPLNEVYRMIHKLLIEKEINK